MDDAFILHFRVPLIGRLENVFACTKGIRPNKGGMGTLGLPSRRDHRGMQTAHEKWGRAHGVDGNERTHIPSRICWCGYLRDCDPRSRSDGRGSRVQGVSSTESTTSSGD
jgi:hypothetical protein